MEIARTSSTPVAISSRYFIRSSHQLLRRGAERGVVRGVAGNGGEQIAIQAADQTGQRGLALVGQPRFPDVLGRRLRDMKAQRLAAIELEHEREEAMAERFGVAPGARQPFG